ncbi:MAG: DUF4129 domain-containing protein [Candidatus Kariarchaeaceae archaeon]|jgi:hypothetical protein
MKITLTEMSIYLTIGLVFFAAVTIPALLVTDPNLTPPTRSSETSDQSSFSNPFTSTPSLDTSINTGDPGTVNNSPGEIENLSGINFNFNFLTYIILTIAAIIFLIFLIRTVSTFRSYAIDTQEKKSEKEQVRKVKDARTQAYQILHEGLLEKIYTEPYIRAYQALDTNLDYFREIARPKYWTPKEYAFSVREPIFRPSVYIFVKQFYNLRYGKFEADATDLEQFIYALDRLFVKDIDTQEKEDMEGRFAIETQSISSYQYPEDFDPTKPKRARR